MQSNRVITAVSLLFCALAFVTTNSPLALGFLAAIVVIVASSLALGARRAARARFSFGIRNACTAGEQVSLEAELWRPRALRGRIELVFEVHDLLFDEVVQQPVSLFPGAGSPERFNVPVDTSACGHTEVRLASAYMLDPLGLARTRLPGAVYESSITVYPRVQDLDVQITRANNASTTSISYDPRRSGQDRTEVFDLREFAPGDSLKSVHWKLSARFDDLMVREPSRPAGYDVALLCGMHVVDPQDANALQVLAAGLCMLSSISMGLLRRGTPHTVGYSDGSELHATTVDSLAAFGSMMDALMCVPLHEHVLTDADECGRFCRAHNVTKTIVVTDKVDRDMFTKLGEHSTLTIVHVSEGEHGGMEELPNASFVHIPASACGRIKNLEL